MFFTREPGRGAPRLPLLALGLGLALASAVLARGDTAPIPALSARTLSKLAPGVGPAVGKPGIRRYVVQLREPVRSEDYAALALAGARVKGRYYRVGMAAVAASGRVLTR